MRPFTHLQIKFSHALTVIDEDTILQRRAGLRGKPVFHVVLMGGNVKVTLEPDSSNSCNC